MRIGTNNHNNSKVSFVINHTYLSPKTKYISSNPKTINIPRPGISISIKPSTNMNILYMMNSFQFFLNGCLDVLDSNRP